MIYLNWKINYTKFSIIKILENKRGTYINNSNYQGNTINYKDSSIYENEKEIKQEQEQNEINAEENKEIGEFMKEILENHIIKLKWRRIY